MPISYVSTSAIFRPLMKILKLSGPTIARQLPINMICRKHYGNWRPFNGSSSEKPPPGDTSPQRLPKTGLLHLKATKGPGIDQALPEGSLRQRQRRRQRVWTCAPAEIQGSPPLACTSSILLAAQRRQQRRQPWLLGRSHAPLPLRSRLDVCPSRGSRRHAWPSRADFYPGHQAGRLRRVPSYLSRQGGVLDVEVVNAAFFENFHNVDLACNGQVNEQQESGAQIGPDQALLVLTGLDGRSDPPEVAERIKIELRESVEITNPFSIHSEQPTAEESNHLEFEKLYMLWAGTAAFAISSRNASSWTSAVSSLPETRTESTALPSTASESCSVRNPMANASRCHLVSHISIPAMKFPLPGMRV
ncbi:hypothetical protein L1887_50697 [Cichorium endivia]|nr:hypothetical protein L1887_50697 [Cichorium endivia]